MATKNFADKLKKNPTQINNVPDQAAGLKKADTKKTKGRPPKDESKGNKKDYCKTINIQVPKDVLEKVEIAKCKYNNNLTDYINALIVSDIEKNMSKYQELYDLLNS